MSHSILLSVSVKGLIVSGIRVYKMMVKLNNQRWANINRNRRQKQHQAKPYTEQSDALQRAVLPKSAKQNEYIDGKQRSETTNSLSPNWSEREKEKDDINSIYVLEYSALKCLWFLSNDSRKFTVHLNIEISMYTNQFRMVWQKKKKRKCEQKTHTHKNTATGVAAIVNNNLWEQYRLST